MKAEQIGILAEAALAKGTVVPFRITGQSMSPTIKLGERVLVKKAAAADLSVGDIALIRSGETYVTHRFFGPARKMSGGHVWHKGDRGRRFDAVPAERVIGEVTQIHKESGSWLKLDRPLWQLVNRLVGLYHYTVVRAGHRLTVPLALKEQAFNVLVRIPNGLVSIMPGAKDGRRA